MADEKHSIQTYVSDMLALERHIAKPFGTQANDKDFDLTSVSDVLRRLNAINATHIENLDSCLKELGGHEAAPVKEAVTQLEGMVAGAIDMVRKTKVSKALRDDYTALALCTAGYTMLQTTALALEQPKVADLAQRHLTDYANCIMEIGETLPEVVIVELRDLGLTVEMSMAEPARRAAEQAWRSGSRNSTTTGTIEGSESSRSRTSNSSL